MQKYQHDIQLSGQQIQKIRQRFNQFSENGYMTVQQFKKSMGLLGIGEAQYLSNRMFNLITKGSYFTFQDFIEFLDKINNGTFQQKAELSFDYLNRQGNGFITYDDIEVIISEISFVWNFLTGEKISTTQSIEIICQKLDISENKSINFSEYITKYDQYFNWYDFFNSSIKIDQSQEKQYYTSMRNNNNEFKVDQIEQYLKLVHTQIQNLLFQFKEQESDNFDNKDIMLEIRTNRGPNSISSKQFQLRGDNEYNFRQTLPYINHQQLSRQIFTEGNNIHDIIANKLAQLSEVSNKLFTNRHVAHSARQKTVQRNSFADEQKKKTVLNITKPSRKRRNIIYFGHQSWNLMLNMMLGIRRSLKSHYYNFNSIVEFTEEDLNCKYYHQLIYKKNEKSVKEISQIFVDYAPKIFYYIRKIFSIDNTQFLKSIGLQNLIGNLLMGNLSTLTDQTSQGKSGSFMYYTEDSKIIVKSIGRDQYKKLRSILQDYTDYVRKNPNTFIMRIYGLYKMKNKSSNRQIYFMVIANVFDKQIEIDERYDIKGATHNRQTLQKNQDLFTHSLFNKNIALKDVDLMNNRGRVFDIEPNQKQKIYRQILQDAQFLKNHNIIQYSLLVGVHNTTSNDFTHNQRQVSIFDKGRSISKEIMSKNKKESYFFGIIDILSEYTAKKVFQNKFFGLINDISCRDPQEYYMRFQKFIYKYIFGN